MNIKKNSGLSKNNYEAYLDKILFDIILPLRLKELSQRLKTPNYR